MATKQIPENEQGYQPCEITVRLGDDLKGRLRSYFVISMKSSYSDDYIAAVSARSGETVKATARFNGPGGTYAYNVEIDGKTYYLPALFCDEISEATP